MPQSAIDSPVKPRAVHVLPQKKLEKPKAITPHADIYHSSRIPASNQRKKSFSTIEGIPGKTHKKLKILTHALH